MRVPTDEAPEEGRCFPQIGMVFAVSAKESTSLGECLPIFVIRWPDSVTGK